MAQSFGGKHVYLDVEGNFPHPSTKKMIPGLLPKEFTQQFTHHLNFQCLTEEKKISLSTGKWMRRKQKIQEAKDLIWPLGWRRRMAQVLTRSLVVDTISGMQFS